MGLRRRDVPCWSQCSPEAVSPSWPQQQPAQKYTPDRLPSRPCLVSPLPYFLGSPPKYTTCIPVSAPASGGTQPESCGYYESDRYSGVRRDVVDSCGVSQFSSVTQSCLTLCDPMNRRTPGLPVHHQLPEFTQTHAIESVMPSNHLILCLSALLLPSVFPSMNLFQ